MNAFTWIMLGAMAWGIVAGYLAPWLGRIIRHRDTQVPAPPVD